MAQDTVGQGCKNQCGRMFCSALSASPSSLPACPGHTVDSMACRYHTRPAGGQTLQALWLSGLELPPEEGGGCYCACVHLTYPLSPLITKIQPRRALSYHLTPVCPQHSRVSSLFCPLPTPPHSAPLLFWACSGAAVAALIHQAGSALLWRHAP